jgi:FHA domain
MEDQKPADSENEKGVSSLNPHDTFIVENKMALRRLLGLSPSSDGEEAALPDYLVLLHVRGMTERVPLADKASVVLGRADLALNFTPDVDLTPYGAASRGVSRTHARLHFENHQLYITDLDSANGTFIGDERLNPNEPVQLQSGNSVLLGALAVQITFSSTAEE